MTRTEEYRRLQVLLTVDDLRARLRISRTGVYRLIRSGELRPLYLDDRPRFRVSGRRAAHLGQGIDSTDRGSTGKPAGWLCTAIEAA